MTTSAISIESEEAPVGATHVHYHYGSGMVGCMYDYGPEISDTVEEAAGDLASVFDLGAAEKRTLIEQRFIPLGGDYGADYAEIAPCNNPDCPDYLHYVRTLAG